ncbi:hypothetical protein [Nocardiopsis baichengensis]|uniref:hypothetical protein n=1 Tax=Nocardiopsis baichengensis TaxID=280240 RepID=UPI000345936F|nr:hypothetical protein [Nocardiopsis baichengensis]
MVQVGSGRRVRPAGAVRLPGARALRRLAVVTGLLAGGWLLGASAAHAAEDALSAAPSAAPAVGGGLEEAEGAESAARAEGAESAEADGAAEGAPLERVRQVGEAAGGTARGVVDGVDDTVRTTGSTVDSGVESTVGAAEDAVGDRVVADTVRNGRDGVHEGVREITGEPLGDSLGEGDLASTVSDGLGGDASGRVRDGLERVVDRGLDTDPVQTGDASDDRGADAARERGGEGERAPASEHGPAERGPRTLRALSEGAAGERPTAAPGTADRVGGVDDGVEDGAVPETDTSWSGSDSAATGVSSSPFPAPAAGFWLQQRGGGLRPLLRSAALPGDPTLVVRDAADDPSFSPD